MEVWVLIWKYPYNRDSNVSVWADESSALRQACTEIKQNIDCDWDMGDIVMVEYAKVFNEHIAQSEYEKAIKVWNDFQNDYNDEQGQWYSISKSEVLGLPDVQGSCRPPILQGGFKALTAGATCRGPCKEWNEYAYADQPDGTHVCHQCSTFQHIFGTKP